MHTYSGQDLLPFLQGHQSWSISDDAVRPTRLNARALEQIPTAAMRMMIDTAAGIRLRFRTSASLVNLTATYWSVHIEGLPSRPPAAIDVVVGDAAPTSHTVDAGAQVVLDPFTDRVEYRNEAIATVTLPLPGAGERTVELWLPQAAICDLRELRSDAPLELEPDHRPVWVHHGSSISHCFEAESPTRTWPALVARALDLRLHNLAFGGAAMVDPFVARQIRDMPADLITLKLGINVVNADSMRLRSFIPAIDGFLDTIRDGHPDVPLLLISPIVSPEFENRTGPTGMDEQGRAISLAGPDASPDALTLTRIRGALERIVARRPEDRQLHYIDGLNLFGPAQATQGLLPDGLHPNAEGYAVIAENTIRTLNALNVVPWQRA